jgi:hypothetical protein
MGTLSHKRQGEAIPQEFLDYLNRWNKIRGDQPDSIDHLPELVAGEIEIWIQSKLSPKS